MRSEEKTQEYSFAAGFKCRGRFYGERDKRWIDMMNYRTDLAVETAEMIEVVQGKKTEISEESESDVASVEKGERKERICGSSGENVTGYIVKRSQKDEDISVVEIEITDENGEKAFGKRRGRYVTVEVQGMLEPREGINERAAAVLADELAKFVRHDYFLKVLVVGLGNEKVTPDSLGPHTVDKVHITSHLFKLFECDGDFDYSNVCGFAPSVTGVTGLETAELIEKVVSMVRPDVALAIDALAAKNIERLSTTIQLCDTGIMPGSGMGNHRKEISERTVGCPVIAIGVPTVIDSRTLILEAAEETGAWQTSGEGGVCRELETECAEANTAGGSPDQSELPPRCGSSHEDAEPAASASGIQEKAQVVADVQARTVKKSQASVRDRERNADATGSDEPQTASPLEKYLESRNFDMIVTSTDIDQIIKDFSDIIANAINITLHPGIYSKVKHLKP